MTRRHSDVISMFVITLMSAVTVVVLTTNDVIGHAGQNKGQGEGKLQTNKSLYYVYCEMRFEHLQRRFTLKKIKFHFSLTKLCVLPMMLCITLTSSLR